MISEVKTKTKETCIERYGTLCESQNEYDKQQISNNVKNTFLKKCGLAYFLYLTQFLNGQLFSVFRNNYNTKSAIYYCDISKFEGSAYEKVGMKLDHGWLPVYDCGQRVFEWRKSS